MMATEDDESIFNSIFTLLAKSDDEKDPNEVTVFEIKNGRDTLHVVNLGKLSTLLIDFVDERTTETIILNEIEFL